MNILSRAGTYSMNRTFPVVAPMAYRSLHTVTKLDTSSIKIGDCAFHIKKIRHIAIEQHPNVCKIELRYDETDADKVVCAVGLLIWSTIFPLALLAIPFHFTKNESTHKFIVLKKDIALIEEIQKRNFPIQFLNQSTAPESRRNSTKKC